MSTSGPAYNLKVIRYIHNQIYILKLAIIRFTAPWFDEMNFKLDTYSKQGLNAM